MNGTEADCAEVKRMIQECRAELAELIAARDDLIHVLHDGAYSERDIGRLLGISGVRVHQVLERAA